MDPPETNIYLSKQAPDSSPYVPSYKDFHAHITYSLLDSPTAGNLCDVVLETCDGHEVPACRALLASHSDYFRSIFFSEFQESTQKTIRVAMSKQVLRYVLIFAYTGFCPLVESGLDCTDFTQIHAKHEELKLLVQLSAAADYCGFYLLHGWCDSSLLSICNKFPVVSCTVLAAMNGEAAHRSLRAKLHDVIGIYYKNSFNVPEGLGKRSYAETVELRSRRRKLNLPPFREELEEVEEEDSDMAYGYGAYPRPSFPTSSYHRYPDGPVSYEPFTPRTPSYLRGFSRGGRGRGRGALHSSVYHGNYEMATPISNYGKPVSHTEADSKTYGVLVLPPHELNDVLFHIEGYVCHEYLVQCIFYWVTKGVRLNKKHRKLRSLKATDGDDVSVSEVGREKSTNESEEGIINVEEDRFEWGKKLAAKLNPKLMRIRFVYDYVIPTGLLEDINAADLLRDHMLSSTPVIQEI